MAPDKLFLKLLLLWLREREKVEKNLNAIHNFCLSLSLSHLIKTFFPPNFPTLCLKIMISVSWASFFETLDLSLNRSASFRYTCLVKWSTKSLIWKPHIAQWICLRIPYAAWVRFPITTSTLFFNCFWEKDGDN